ncbi:long-chain fatty acid--CoA ligase [Desulfovibrio sulfodismutans]|uniref:Long-chain fatty acid--CoA ligase n=2 Tax=Desulfolutivibrio sulfodismutans TaxID=63561 RepID=A0A7K3NQ36_9BACT|nr:AMP-binding protein [Desulfolutivibrio sulfodismutans]NDY58227.1 long-chain fatty acid--CoA ligase [Desulfolutivibrio sulfodismutans]QLA12811.1 AMP-binding protein [Desulfolutivibrio sulfodismutans DSM 3696]
MGEAPKPYFDTLPGLLCKNARAHGKKTALREKQWGVWQRFSWNDYLAAAAEFAGGLKKMGFGRGDIVILIGDNRPEWLFAELAIQALGGMALGLYQDAPAEEIAYILELSEARLVVAEDQEQVDKMLSLRQGLPQLAHIVYHDPKGLAGVNEPGLVSFEAVRDMGRDLAGQFPDWAAALSPDDPALIATTSGTTGRPKLAMLSHKNLLAMAHNLGLVDERRPSDEFVSFLPLAWMGEQMMAVASALLFGFTVNFPEEPDTVQDNIREIGPNVIFSPPRVWENLAARVRVKIMETTRLKRFLYDLFLPVGIRLADARFEGKKPGLGLRLAYGVAWFCLFRALKDRLGFSNVRSASTGGAALGPDAFRFFHAIGVNLKQIYGQTEISGISCIHRDGAVDFTSVGQPIPDTELTIAEDGEILSKSPSVFLGYYKNPAATAETLTDDGRLRSGDAGYFDDQGRLVVIDRVKDVMTLKGGFKFSPQFMENKLKFSPYIREAVVFGHDRDHLAAIVCIDAEIVGRWAESKALTYTTYQDLSAKPEVYALVKAEIAAINAKLAPQMRVARFVLLFKELDADDGELTRTRKVRRKVVGDRYGKLVEALYSPVCSMNLRAEITYQDASVREMCGELRLEDVEDRAAG